MKMSKIQFTFYNPTKHYMPITVTLTPRNSNETMSILYNRAVEKVCVERNWTTKELVEKFGYTKYRFRLLKES